MIFKAMFVAVLAISQAPIAHAEGLYQPTAAEMATIEETALDSMPGHSGASVQGLIAGAPVVSIEGEMISWVCGMLHDPASGSDIANDSIFAGYLERASGNFVFAASSDENITDRTTFLSACTAQVLGMKLGG